MDLETPSSSLWACSTKESIENVKFITSQPWPETGLEEPPSSLEDIANRIFCILLVRVVAILSCRESGSREGKKYFRACDVDLKTVNKFVSNDIQQELHDYVTFIISQYRDIHYHNMHHAYHVVISANKLLDIFLQEKRTEHITTFGIRSDPLLQLALIFAALIHDVDHPGVSNGQLVLEEDELATLYNDQSCAEQHSLAIAFKTLTKPRFARLKKTLFHDSSEYRSFRKTVIDLVFATDVASPERMQITKSKFKEAFGEIPKNALYTQIPSNEDDENNNEDDESKKNHLATTKPFLRTSFFYRSSLSMGMKKISLDGMGLSDGSISPSVSLSDGEDDEEIDDDNNAKPEKMKANDGSNIFSKKDNCAQDNLRNSLTRSDSNRRSGKMSKGTSLFESSNNNFRNTTESSTDEDEAMDLRNAFLQKDNRSTRTSLRSLLGEERSSHRSLASNNSRRNLLVKQSSGRRQSCESTVSNYQNVHSGMNSSFRRSSAPTNSSGLNVSEIRLGIRRTMDLAGNTIEGYATSKNDDVLKSVIKNICVAEIDMDNDEPDQLRATVVLETMLRAADVSANMQSWEQMKKWSSILFFELMEAHESGRMGPDPGANWFENQISFIDSYVVPLARKLDVVGVFGELGQQFLSFTLENRRTWMDEGKHFTSWMKRRWIRIKAKKQKF